MNQKILGKYTRDWHWQPPFQVTQLER